MRSGYRDDVDPVLFDVRDNRFLANQIVGEPLDDYGVHATCKASGTST